MHLLDVLFVFALGKAELCVADHVQGILTTSVSFFLGLVVAVFCAAAAILPIILMFYLSKKNIYKLIKITLQFLLFLSLFRVELVWKVSRSAWTELHAKQFSCQCSLSLNWTNLTSLIMKLIFVESVMNLWYAYSILIG